jgi:hypothetical protein
MWFVDGKAAKDMGVEEGKTRLIGYGLCSLHATMAENDEMPFSRIERQIMSIGSKSQRIPSLVDFN